MAKFYGTVENEKGSIGSPGQRSYVFRIFLSVIITVGFVIFVTNFVSTSTTTTSTSITIDQTALAVDTSSETNYPNFIFMMVDDLTWSALNDPNSKLLKVAPNLLKLRSEGMAISQYYSAQMCTPARGSLLTGRYPSRIGLQGASIEWDYKFGLDTRYRLLPSVLKHHNYDTHIIGKWHLGHYSPEYLPTARGFDSHLGYVTGEEYPFTKYLYPDETYKDFMLANKTCFTPYTMANLNNYSTFIYRDRLIDIMQAEKDSAKSFFVYMGMQAVHNPFDDEGYSDGIPANYVSKEVHDYINTKVAGGISKQYAVSLNIIDQAMGEILTKLRELDLYDNTYIIFSADHGGCYKQGGKAGPLRGTKGTLWEGGMRVGAFISGGAIPEARRNTTMSGFMHVSDWFPTILDLAGIENVYEQELNGVSQFSAIMKDSISNRHEMLYDCITNYSSKTYVLDTNCTCGVRNDRYKLVHQYLDGVHENWFYSDYIAADDNIDSEESCGFVMGGDSYVKLMYDLVNDPYETTNLYDSTDEAVIIAKKELYETMTRHYHSAVKKKAATVAESTAASVFTNVYGNYVGPFVNYETNLPKYCPKVTFPPNTQN